MPSTPAPVCIHKLVTGDEVGQLKAVAVSDKGWSSASIAATWGTPKKEEAVLAILSSSEPSVAGWLIVARTKGRLEVVRPDSGEVVTKCTVGCSLSTVAALSISSNSSKASTPQVLCCTTDGLLRTFDSSAALDDSSATWKQSDSFKVCSTPLCMAVSSSESEVVVGGEGAQVGVWDRPTQQRVWQAKGDKPSSIGLVDPAHVTAVSYVPYKEDKVILTGTPKHKLMLYDIRAGRRPQMVVTWGEAKITCMAAEKDGGRIWCANGTGSISALDLAAGKMWGALKGQGGAVRQLALWEPEEGVQGGSSIASVGLSRYLLVHSTRSQALQCKVYMKTAMTAVAWASPPQPQEQDDTPNDNEAEKEGSEEEEEEEEEEERGRGRRKPHKKRQKR